MLMQADRLGNLLTYAQNGIERSHRLLKNHGDIPAAFFPHGFFGERQKILTVKQHPAPGDLTIGGNQPHDGKRQHSFAATGLPHDAQRFTGAKRQRNAVNRPNNTSFG
jgi:hypothetical protein